MTQNHPHEDAKSQKKNTFTDFIACAEHLIAERYTGTERLPLSPACSKGFGNPRLSKIYRFFDQSNLPLNLGSSRLRVGDFESF
jgi:hypothetical protein